MARVYGDPRDYTQELHQMTDTQIYAEAKSMRDALIKRYRRLSDNIERDPVTYSQFGQKAMQNQSEEMEIPAVSISMGRRQLQVQARELYRLMGMKTTTSQGAKKHQREVIRNMAGVNTQGRLRAAEQRQYDKFENFLRSNPDQLSNFWKAFNFYKNENKHRNLDSNQLLEDFREDYDAMTNDGLRDPEDFFDRIQEIVTEKYEETEEAKREASELGRRDMW